MNLIIKAAQFAAKYHEGQKRKFNGTPYIWHPMRVAGRVMMLSSTCEEMVAAAWLHDVREDCGVTSSAIEIQFGRSVGIIVDELTNPSIGSTLSRAERKRIDREHLANVSLPAKIIKLIDRIDNLRETDTYDPNGLNPFTKIYKQESLLLLQCLACTNVGLEQELFNLCGGQ